MHLSDQKSMTVGHARIRRTRSSYYVPKRLSSYLVRCTGLTSIAIPKLRSVVDRYKRHRGGASNQQAAEE